MYLYKFTRLSETSIINLDSSLLWFSSLADFNDPFEGKFNIRDNQNRIAYDNSNDYAENTLNSHNLRIPVKGFYEMRITDTTADDFEILLGIRES